MTSQHLAGLAPSHETSSAPAKPGIALEGRRRRIVPGTADPADRNIPEMGGSTTVSRLSVAADEGLSKVGFPDGSACSSRTDRSVSAGHVGRGARGAFAPIWRFSASCWTRHAPAVQCHPDAAFAAGTSGPISKTEHGSSGDAKHRRRAPYMLFGFREGVAESDFGASYRPDIRQIASLTG